MKNLGHFLLIVCLLGCTTVKTTQKKLNSGSYDTAIEDALKKLRPNKSKKSAQPYVFLLQEAYEKAQKRDADKARQLEISNSYPQLKSLYGIYAQMDRRQKKIEPILPLKNLQTKKPVPFSQKDYFPQLQQSLSRWSTALQAASSQTLQQSSAPKDNYRILYDAYLDLSQVQAWTTAQQSIANELQFRGTNFVRASVENATEQIIPERLENELLNIPSGAHQNRWAVFHQKPQEKVPYTYAVRLQFEAINISPERIQEKVFESEQKVEDGTTVLKDEDGNQVKDSLGNAIEVPRFKTVRSVFYESLQQKTLRVRASLILEAEDSKEVLTRLPLETQWVFEHRFGTFTGDRRALRKNWIRLITLKQLPFPSNEEMLIRAADQIKGEYLALLRRLPL